MERRRSGLSDKKKLDGINTADLGYTLPANASELRADDRADLVSSLKIQAAELGGAARGCPRDCGLLIFAIQIWDGQVNLSCHVLGLAVRYVDLHIDIVLISLLSGKLYEPLYTKQYEIVNGVVEVESVKTEITEETCVADKSNEEKGVLDFWLIVMKTNQVLAEEAILHCCQRFCTTGLPSDVSVEVEEISFHLHKVAALSINILFKALEKFKKGYHTSLDATVSSKDTLDNYQEYLMLRAQVECLQRSQRISISFVLEGGDGQKLQSVESLLFDLATIKDAIDNFSEANKLGQGGFGPVYKKIDEYRQCARRGQAEKEFKVEVEAIGKVRHKNLVGLLGYCVEAAKRLLVYEYVDNGTLEQWLHGDVGTFSPLTWDIRMKTALDRSSTLLNVVCCQCIFRRSQIRI
ncbi:hypothetical protein J5N97_024593 [Dioscorea zingiberensis]|uniref:Protein kinase domain-containing protein n=1 Tax=Dioscorea zingiberensis TaxID=325984 RepID=A0A9D5C6P7_9LILI|nr:hypothetical protein J5N97_024593 [Dioscorea zingiberensis]